MSNTPLPACSRSISGLGFGWTPEHLVEGELRRGVLVPLRWKRDDVHVFEPGLHVRPGRDVGRAAKIVVSALRRAQGRRGPAVPPLASR